MVKRKELEKLSDHALEKYILPQSKFVSEAIQYAFEILKDRGRVFSEAETQQILSLINSKQAKEIESDSFIKNELDKNITENESAIELYTNKLIFAFSVFFGVVFGTFLQVYNYYKIKNYKGLVVTLVFGFLYTFLQIIIVNLIENNTSYISSIRFLFSGIGALGLLLIRNNIFKDDLKYRAKSFVIPLIISVLVCVIIFYLIITSE